MELLILLIILFFWRLSGGIKKMNIKRKSENRFRRTRNGIVLGVFYDEPEDTTRVDNDPFLNNEHEDGPDW